MGYFLVTITAECDVLVDDCSYASAVARAVEETDFGDFRKTSALGDAISAEDAIRNMEVIDKDITIFPPESKG